MRNIVILMGAFLIVLINPASAVAEAKEEKILNDFLYTKDIEKEEENA